MNTRDRNVVFILKRFVLKRTVNPLSILSIPTARVTSWSVLHGNYLDVNNSPIIPRESVCQLLWEVILAN